jgi:4-hydroxythreonine-4-phosphate dehydrogenase
LDQKAEKTRLYQDLLNGVNKRRRSGAIGITLGDAAGIGPEIITAALASGRLPPEFEYRIIGEIGPAQAGFPSPDTARAAQAALEESARMALTGEIDAVVTGPIHKARMHAIGFEFPGQTEFFAARADVKNFAMLLTGGALTVALVTAHIPLRRVAETLNRSEIVRVGLLLEDFLLRRLGRAPRIAVAGLNPHAGESGALGGEEIEIIAPAVADLARAGSGESSFTGPLSPDTVFHRATLGEFDGVLCMYHDQGLIPLKLHAFDEGVNVTLGLPFPRTSPDHGTAFEIAGCGVARPDSMIAAIRLAAALSKEGALQ